MKFRNDCWKKYPKNQSFTRFIKHFLNSNDTVFQEIIITVGQRFRPEIRSTAFYYYAKIPLERLQHKESLSKTSSSVDKK